MFFGCSLRSLLPSFFNLILARLLVSPFCWIAFVSGARKKAHTRFTPQNTMEFIDFQGARLHRRRRQDKENKANTTNNVTNNAVFVGSTSDLSKMIKQQFLNNSNKD